MRRGVLTVVALAILGPPPSAGVASPSSPTLRDAERQLRRVPRLPMRLAREPFCEWGYSSGIAYELETAEECFRYVIHTHGPSTRAYVGLGRSQMGLGKYEAAMRSFRRGLRLGPTDAVAHRWYRRSCRLLRVARSVTHLLPREHSVVAVHRFGVGRWLVLSAVVRDSGHVGDYRQARLSLFREAAKGHRKIWQSDRLRDPGDAPNDHYWNVTLCVADLTGDGVPEAAVFEFVPAASTIPCHLDLFTPHRQGLTKVFGMTSTLPVWIEDLNRDGRYEIGNYYNIGYSMSHVEQPYWSDIYAFRKGGWGLANRDFPRAFRGWVRLLREVLEDRPEDPEILEYLGVVHEIEHRPAAALAAHRRAADAYGDWIPSRLRDRLRASVRARELTLVGFTNPRQSHPDSQLCLAGGWSRARGWIRATGDGNAPISPTWQATRWQFFRRFCTGPITIRTRPSPVSARELDCAHYELLSRVDGGVAITRAVHPRPRLPQPLRTDQPELRTLTRQLLQQCGVRAPAQPRILEAWGVDLDGDGRQEVLWTSRSREEWRLPYFDPKLPGHALPHDYALLGLRYRLGRSVKSVALALEARLGASAPVPTQHGIFTPLDIDGDGRLEILVHAQYFEDDELLVFTFDGRRVAGVLGTRVPVRRPT